MQARVRRCRGVRMRRLLVLLLIFALLAPALPAKAETTSYYAVYLDYSDGTNDYIDVSFLSSTGTERSVIIITHIEGSSSEGASAGSYTLFGAGREADNTPFWFRYRYGAWGLQVGNGTDWVSVAYGAPSPKGKTVFAGVVFDNGRVALYLDGQKVKEETTSITFFNTSTYGKAIGSLRGDMHFLKGKIYLVLIYERALTDEEVQAIYEDPLNPPTSGLAVFYAPDSLDTVNKLWFDKSGQGNDGTIVGNPSYVELRPVAGSEPSKSTPYALKFDPTDGTKDYIDVSSLPRNGTARTVIGIFKPYADVGMDVSVFGAGAEYDNTIFWLYNRNGQWRLKVGNGTNMALLAYSKPVEWNNTIFVSGVFDNGYIALYYNGQKVKEATTSITHFNITNGHKQTLGALRGGYHFLYGEMYMVLIYERGLSDAEIQAIYEDPENPPLDGLVLWYSPYTYDPSSDKWLNRAPIFPTIPLAEEIDGQNYGATAERVSIPRLYVYDANTSEQISYMNVGLTLIANNTTTGLIPSLPILPWNETVTLNVSATNYESASLSTWSGVDLISVYLEPIGTTTEKEETLLTQPTEPPTAPTEPFFNYTNDYGFFGFRLGDKLMHFQIDEVIPEFFNLTPIFAIFIPLIMTLSIGVAAWYYSRNSLVVLGVLAVMNTFFFLLRLKVELSMVGPLTALVIFFVAWIFWDLYKSKERV